MPNQDVNLFNTDPGILDYQRRQALAQALSQQAQQPEQTYSGPMGQAPVASYSPLARGLEGFLGAYMQRKNQDKLGALQSQQKADFGSTLAKYLQQPNAIQASAPDPSQAQVNITPNQDPMHPGTVSIGNQGPTASVGPRPLSSQEQMARALAMMGNNNPLVQQIAPGLVQQAMGRVQDEQKNQMPLSQAGQDQIRLQGQESRSDALYKNGLPMTPAETAQHALEQQKLAETSQYHKQMMGMGLDENGAPNPYVQSHVSNIASGNETMAQVPGPLKNAVSLAMTKAPKAIFAPIAMQRLTTAASKITAQFTNLAGYKLAADGLPYLERIDAAMHTPGSVSDQDLLDSLTKLNTGGNAVTEAQVSTITGGKSWADSAGVWANKLKNGGVLSDNQRQQIHDIANAIYANYQTGYQPLYNKAVSQLKAAGIPEAFWTIPDLNNLQAWRADNPAQAKSAAPGAAPAGGAPQIAPAGTKATGPGGTVLTSDGKGGWN